MPTLPPPRVIVGALAQRLLDARDERHTAECAVEDLLEIILPGWHAKFPRAQGWIWTPPNTIDVFYAEELPAAIAALHLAGFFTGVTIHAHGPERFLSCSCVRRVP